MNISNQDIELMYDISMNIGMSNELEPELYNCLHTLNKKLNLTYSIVQINNSFSEEIIGAGLFSLPKNIVKSENHKDFLEEALNLELGDSQIFQKDQTSVYVYCFDLGELGKINISEK